jgi:hypothetical protein
MHTPNFKDFPVKRLTALESQLHMWNLRALQSTTSKIRSQDKSLPVVEQLKATGLDLDFSSEQKRTRFESHFECVSIVRTEQVHQSMTGRKVTLSQAHKLSREASHAPTIRRRDTGQTGSEITARGIPPTVNEIPHFSFISLASDNDAITPAKKIE